MQSSILWTTAIVPSLLALLTEGTVLICSGASVMVWRWRWVTRLSSGHVNLNKGTGKRRHCPMSTWKLPTPPPSNQSHFKLCDHSHLDNVFASPSKADVSWCLRNALWNMGIDVLEERNKVPLSSTVSPCMLLYKQVMGNLQHRVNVLWAFSVAACERGNM